MALDSVHEAENEALGEELIFDGGGADNAGGGQGEDAGNDHGMQQRQLQQEQDALHQEQLYQQQLQQQHLQQQQQHQPGMRRPVSMPQLTGRSSASRASASSTRSSPFRLQPPFQAPKADHTGFAKFQLYRPSHTQDWDERHHMEFTRKGDRKAHKESSPSLLRDPEGKEPKPPRSPITPDCAPPVLHERHAFGGSMKDRDQRVRPWSDRWHTGIHRLNDGMHHSHRQYFVQKSIYETAPSQQWRRYTDQQVGPGQWLPIETKRPHPFPTLGV